jgi:pimeloyl-ACP methyl ester carboxylesterase
MALDWPNGNGFLTAGGKSLEWAVFGPAPGALPVIVLLHEGLGCVALWRDFPERLAATTGHPVFVYSRAGYGWSDPDELPRPLDYMTREAVNVLPDVLNEIDAPGYVLFGHSDGASIAAIHAGKVIDPRVVGLILMAPHFFTESMGLAEIADAKTMFETTNLKERMGRYHRDPEAAFRGWNDAWLDPGFKAWNIEDCLDTLSVPTLALQGVDDQYGTEAQVRIVEKRSPRPVDVVLIDDCKHSPQFDQPDATLQAVGGYIARLQDAPLKVSVE